MADTWNGAFGDAWGESWGAVTASTIKWQQSVTGQVQNNVLTIESDLDNE